MHSHSSRFHSGVQFAPYQDLTFNHYTNMPQHEYVSHQGHSPFSWARKSVAHQERARLEDARVREAEERQMQDVMARMQTIEGKLDALAMLQGGAAAQRWEGAQRCPCDAFGGGRGREEDRWGGGGSNFILLVFILILLALFAISRQPAPSPQPPVAMYYAPPPPPPNRFFSPGSA